MKKFAIAGIAQAMAADFPVKASPATLPIARNEMPFIGIFQNLGRRIRCYPRTRLRRCSFSKATDNAGSRR